MVFFLSKRKGADFKHLLDEGLSKCHQVVSFPSLEDFLAEEFMHGVGPMLSVRGESILSWIGGGDFVLEDATTSTHEGKGKKQREDKKMFKTRNSNMDDSKRKACSRAIHVPRKYYSEKKESNDERKIDQKVIFVIFNSAS